MNIINKLQIDRLMTVDVIMMSKKINQYSRIYIVICESAQKSLDVTIKVTECAFHHE